ncbi:FimV/HubP family polar landmark protein [Vibrio sp. YIC-376]|uniref:FimV/HubP family polar landmark protein n=1 Tax=Vibrio sp. YIC-376 TaxID=3136162 RepID=UPI00402AAEA4
MRQIYKRLLTTLVLMSATQISSVVQAEGIRLVGPSGEVQSSPRYAEEIERALPVPPVNSQPSRFIGPTGENQTLWSIASQIRPSRSVSIQQTLLAIYRINPQAFENQNIHELIPGSRLRVPSLEQVQSATTEQAIAIMKAHEAKLTQPTPVKKTASVQPVTQQPKSQTQKPQPPKPQPPKPQPPKPQPQSTEETGSLQPKAVVPQKEEPVKTTEPTSPISAVNTSPQGEQQVIELKNKLQGSQSELASLEEKNHRLRLMLSEVQNEVQTLKSELNDEGRIRTEVEKLLTEERQRAAEQQRMQPSTLDKFLSNGWLVGLAALIPGALIAFLIVILLGRRAKENEEQVAQQQSPVVDPLAAPVGLAAVGELEEELSLDDDLFEDDLFTDDSDTSSVKDSIPELGDDVFAGLEDEELDFNLEGEDGEDPFARIDDDGALDVGFDEFESSPTGIKVNGDEKALGLEEMERALDKVPHELETLDDPDFDLSDDDRSDKTTDDEFEELLAEDASSDPLPGHHVDQAMLDELFAELDSNDLDLDLDTPPAIDTAFSAGEASDDEIDKLLAQYEQTNSEKSDVKSEPSFEFDKKITHSQTDHDDLLAHLEDFEGVSANIGLDENSTDLLDDIVEFDDEESDKAFDPLSELESLAGLNGEDIDELDADSTDLLDELLSAEVSTELDDEAISELDPFDELIREDEVSETEQLKREEDDILASLGFEDKTAEVPTGQADEEDVELESGLDIDALLNENQAKDVLETPELHEPEKQTSDELVNHELLDDIEDISLEYDPLMRELDELFELNHDDIKSTAQDNNETLSDVDALPGEQEESDREAIPTETETVGQNKEAYDEALVEPSAESSEVSEEEPETESTFTPTPNAVENEFGMPSEEDWLLDDLEPESETNLEKEPVAATLSESSEEEFGFDDLELPEFDEEDALASMAGEPELPESEPEANATASEADEEFEFDELALPEFGEEDALVSMAVEPELPESEPEADATASEAEEEFEFDELALPEFGEEEAPASMAGEPELPESEPKADATASEAEEEFEFDELELPEFGEEEALASMADEPELPESEPEADVTASEAEDEFEFDELELPEFGEEEALASMSAAVSSEQVQSELPKIKLQSDNDHDALFEVFAHQGGFDSEDESLDIRKEPELGGFDESDMANLLSEKGDSEVFDGKLDSNTINSAGMDIETMLDVGDDWDGFKPAATSAITSEAEDVPEDERDVWRSEEALTQPEIEQENWGKQTDLADFDPQKNQFMTIDELMAQVDLEGGEFEEEELNLDVGLDEFPDVIGDISDIDVDSDAEGAGKLDLAKIYLEMNDPKGAIKLLEEAIVYGEDEVRREAKNLIDTINRR